MRFGDSDYFGLESQQAMQVLLVAIGSHGDVLPHLALAAELQRRGHEVTLAAPAPFARAALRVGVPFHSIGTEWDYTHVTSPANLWHPMHGLPLLLRIATATLEPTYEWIAANWRPQDGVVVGSTLALGARAAQQKLGVPLVTVHLFPLLADSRRAAPVPPGVPLGALLPGPLRHAVVRLADHFLLEPATLPHLNAALERLDIAPVTQLRRWWDSPDRVVFAFPPWFCPPQTDWPTQAIQTSFPLADRFGDTDELGDDVAAFLDQGSPPLVFTYGTAMRQAADFFRTATAICARLGRRGILVSVPEDQMTGRPGPDLLHVSYAPFSRLLPRCAALIHHGGIGTVAQAMAAGIPQLLVPLGFNHFDEAARLQRLNLGRSIARRSFTPERGAAAIAGLLADPKVAVACAGAKALLGQDDGIRSACNVIERLPREAQARPSVLRMPAARIDCAPAGSLSAGF